MDETGVKMDIAPAYALEGDNSIIREVRFDRAGGVITVADTFALAKAPAELIERFVSRQKPEETAEGIVIGNAKASMTLNIIEGNATAKVYSGTEKDHGGKPFTVWYVDYVANNAESDCAFKFELK